MHHHPWNRKKKRGLFSFHVPDNPEVQIGNKRCLTCRLFAEVPDWQLVAGIAASTNAYCCHSTKFINLQLGFLLSRIFRQGVAVFLYLTSSSFPRALLTIIAVERS